MENLFAKNTCVNCRQEFGFDHIRLMDKQIHREEEEAELI